ncbi:MAG: M20/M25/M40 family metallo-hydrolase [Candidatus Kariarchaeaceae archaeon]|jgi:acetylornithine deacetylase/succinyl-diaminopimelate desuccinylase-like protein
MSLRNDVVTWLNSIDYISELKEYISYPSRSRKREEVRISSEFSLKLFNNIGLKSQLFETSGNPVVYGESIAGEGMPTLLIYGHHDVQPEGDLEKWDTPPFEATVIGSKLYGRGSADNKGQHYAHILAIRYLKEKMPEILKKINIKFMLDGDEEIGSFSLPGFMKENVDQLKADFMYFSDGPNFIDKIPSVCGGTRGMLTFQITIEHNPEDLHSGNFGGVGRTASLDLIKLLNTMVRNDGKCLIEGFYDDVAPPSEKEAEVIGKLDGAYDKIIEARSLTRAVSIDGKSNAFMNELWPTFNVNGLKTGNVGDKRRTVIPREAIASIGCRLVPDQDPQDLKLKIKDHVDSWVEKNEIKGAVTVTFENSMKPIPSSINSPYIDLVVDAAREGFAEEPLVINRLGASMETEVFPKYLGLEIFNVPYALVDENNHAPNENLDIPFFESGVCTTVALLTKLSTEAPKIDE